ncbi:MAG: hypothetical protein H6822_22070 [Planctomycetaceae bacterium]|nr:hypothetical protein [Planctomycetaceae bacterium]
MKKFLRFVATGYVFGIGVEIQYRLMGRFNPQALAAAIFLYPFILSFAWLGQKVIDKCVSRRLVADIACYFACGISGLAIEWILLGNSPSANPNAIQIGMFCMWATFCFGPRLLIRQDDSTRRLRRRVWQFFGAYFALSTVIGLLIPAPQTRFVVIILVSVAAYIGINVLLLWLMIQQHRNETTRRQVLDNDDEAMILAEIVQPADAGSAGGHNR